MISFINRLACSNIHPQIFISVSNIVTLSNGYTKGDNISFFYRKTGFPISILVVRGSSAPPIGVGSCCRRREEVSTD